MRIVSLVPSLTETVHDLGLGGSLVGVTKFCVRPESARETAMVVGGTKDPDVPRILSLRPDLILCDEDENRPEHIAAFRAAQVAVHVTRIETVADVAREMVAIGTLLGRGHEAEKYAADLHEAAAKLRGTTNLAPPISCFVPIWKKPLMTMGGRTYMSDLLRHAGGENIFAEVEKKYFEVDALEVRDRVPAAILLPTEPYRFRESDRKPFADRFEVPLDLVRVVDGQAFTWFGTGSLAGLEVLGDAVAHVRSVPGTAPPSPQKP